MPIVTMLKCLPLDLKRLFLISCNSKVAASLALTQTFAPCNTPRYLQITRERLRKCFDGWCCVNLGCIVHYAPSSKRDGLEQYYYRATNVVRNECHWSNGRRNGIERKWQHGGENALDFMCHRVNCKKEGLQMRRYSFYEFPSIDLIVYRSYLNGKPHGIEYRERRGTFTNNLISRSVGSTWRYGRKQ